MSTESSDLIAEAKLKQESRWVFFELDNEWYGIPVEQVRELIITPKITPVPQAPAFVLGIIKLRDSTLPVIDLRLRLGRRSLREMRKEMTEMNTRRADHVEWLAALKRSVSDGEPFTKALDPHQCAFGKWYDTYKTDDLTLSGLLKKFNDPHQRIHALGGEVLGLLKEGRPDDAQSRIQIAETGTLALLLGLFDQVIKHLAESEQQVTVVTELSEGVIGLSVDRIESVYTLTPEEIDPSPAMAGPTKHKHVVKGCAKPKSLAGKMVLLIDTNKVMDAEDLKQLTGGR